MSDEFDYRALYEEVQKYVEYNGGSVVVAGGIQIQKWPGDRERDFTVAIKCLGRPPEPNQAQEEGRVAT